MVALRTSLLALWSVGCFVDAVGLPAPAGGDAAGAAAPVAGGPVGGNGEGAGPSGGGATGGGPPGRQECPPGELVATIDDGLIACEPIATELLTAISGSCAVHYGWRDGCDAGCTMGPDKWGKVTGTGCLPTGGDCNCQTQDLGANLALPLFGLNMDGGVDEEDRFFSAFSCTPGTSAEVPCGPGRFVTGYDGENTTCAPVSGAALDYVRASCALVTGWRDQCSNCDLEPTKYTSTTTLACDAGMAGSCGEFTLGEDTLQMASFDTDGTVDDDDRFYIGLRCEDAVHDETPAARSCLAGQFVTGVTNDGDLLCRNLDELAMRVFREHCSLYYGWRNDCNNCPDPPAKWGRVGDGSCSLGTGADDSCGSMMLGGQLVDLFGLNTDSNVDNGDMFYVAFRCEPEWTESTQWTESREVHGVPLARSE